MLRHSSGDVAQQTLKVTPGDMGKCEALDDVSHSSLVSQAGTDAEALSQIHWEHRRLHPNKNQQEGATRSDEDFEL